MPDLAAPAADGVSMTLDGRPITAKKGEMLIAAAERAGTYIPRFCYHPRMKPVGMCRMCLVEIKGPRGFNLSPACFIPVADGMEVQTKSPNVKKAQDGVLEFLLVNHPLDCPVCDKGGECPLQDQTLAYGPGETRFVEEKRHWDKPVPLSSLVLIDRERCIQCARCTRFAEEVAGEPAIDLASRSDSTEVAIYPGQPFTSNFSGNIVQICPVGALLAKPYRFKARPWDLEQVETTCTLCAVGCRVAAQSSSEEVVRFIGVDSDPVNWGWLCDKGRFGFEALNSPERLGYPLVRRTVTNSEGEEVSGLVEVSWAEAFAEITARAGDAHGERVGVIGGARLANEDAYAWAKLARTVLRTDNVDAQLGDGLPGDVLASLPRATIDQVCEAPLIVTVAPDIKEELPVLYLRLRHAAVEKGTPIIELSPVGTGLTPLATQSLRYRPGELSTLARALCSEAAITENVAGVPARQAERARAAIASAATAQGPGAGASGPTAGGALSVAVVIGRPSLAEAASGATEAALLFATLPGARFLPALHRANIQGAIDLGLAPGLLPGRVGLQEGREWYEQHWHVELPADAGLDALGILTRAAEGRIDALFLVGADPVSDCPDKGLAALALQTARLVVAVDAFATESVAYADVVLPAAVYTERRGSFTNIEGRVTWLGQKVTAPGTARPDWMIAVELASRLGPSLGASSLEELWSEIEAVSPLHAGASSALLTSRSSRDGVVVPLSGGGSEPAGPPPPLDPMADPGIVSAEAHPVPPTGLAGGAGQSNVASPGAAPPGVLRQAARSAPPRLQPRPPGAAAEAVRRAATSGTVTRVAAASQGSGMALRLVARRPMWDGGVLVQRSPSLANLHPVLALALNPADLSRLAGRTVRVSSGRGSIVVPAVPDASVPEGAAVLPFNLPEGGAGLLVDASAPYTEVIVEQVGPQ